MKRNYTYQKNKLNMMDTKTEDLVDLIFNKLKNYRNKKIFLEKELLKKFIFSLFQENQNHKEI